MMITSTALIIAAAVVASLPAAAQSPQAPLTQQTSRASVDVIIQKGFAELIDIPGTIKEFIIGDPDIVDAVPVTSNTFLMNGLERGTTNIIVIDPDGRALYRARVYVRPVRISPEYRVNVVHGTSLGHGYSCDRESGCESRAPQNLYLGQTTANTSATAVGTGGQTAPAPALASD